MKKVLLLLILSIVIGCGKEFEPELTGRKAYTLPGQPRVHLEMDGRETIVEISGDENSSYRYTQWTHQDHILLAQLTKTDGCYDYQIISIDTTGAILDTIYTAPPNTPVNFKLAPNDTLLLLKTYSDNCTGEFDNFNYTFYNRYLKKSLPDTLHVGYAAGIPLLETIWSPDSKKVIIPKYVGFATQAFTYDLVTKDTTYIDKGSNFIWSPIDNDLVSYIKDYSIYTKNIKTGETAVLFEGRKKKGATAFRWDPHGNYLMIHFKSYLLNVDVAPLQQNRIIYLSVEDKLESRIFYDDQRIETWKYAK